MTSTESRSANPIELVLLDVGGPIYDDRVYRDALLRATRELAAEQLDETRFQQVYDAQRARQAGSLRTAVAETFLGIEQRQRLSDRAEQYWAYPPEALYPDVLPALRELRADYRLAIVANQRSEVVRALHRDGIAEHIDAWAISEDVGAEKPDVEIFRHALREASVPATNAVHVGNRLDTDVRGAHRAGLRSVWITRGEAPPNPTPDQLSEPHAVIGSLDRLAETLREMTKRQA